MSQSINNFDMGLGRKLSHDERSRDFPYLRRATSPTRTRLWFKGFPTLDQEDVGACTGFALAHLVNFPRYRASRNKSPLLKRRYATTAHAFEFYHLNTVSDPYPGVYPPNDTGSSGLAAATTAVSLGLATRYEHVFGQDHLISALQEGPVLVGTNWYRGMYDVTDRNFAVEPLATDIPIGGHEYVIYGWNKKDDYFTCLTSWPTYGVLGKFKVSSLLMRRLLSEDGDVTVPIPE